MTIAVFGGNIPSAVFIVAGCIALGAWLVWSIRTYSKPTTPPRISPEPVLDYRVAETGRDRAHSFTEIVRLTSRFQMAPDLLAEDPPTWNWPVWEDVSTTPEQVTSQ